MSGQLLPRDIARVFCELHLSVLERGWLSSNSVVLRPARGGPATVVDTGYDTHSPQTLSLLDAASDGHGVAQVINTHLHSDHCGGNAELQRRWGSDVWVPAVSLDAVRRWDASRLTFELTGQRCTRFSASAGISPGETLSLAGQTWQVFGAPGHDPDATMLFHPASRVLMAGDALWQSRLAIVFQALQEENGFEAVRSVLDCIERLDPSIVIPGHGAPFSDVRAALAYSRMRLAHFRANPERHLTHAARALTMFHMLECRSCTLNDLRKWLTQVPIFQSLLRSARLDDGASAATDSVIRGLVEDALLRLDSETDTVECMDNASRA